MARLANKVAVVTGGAEGIGRACVEAFASEGASVVIADRNVEAGQALTESLQQQAKMVTFIAVDMAVPEQVEALITRTITIFGRLDVLLSNAGIGGRRYGDGPVDICTVQAWDTIMQVNLRGTFLACKYAIPEMVKVGGGSIITMASVLGLVGTQGMFDTHAYTTSKAAIIGLTRSIAAHYAVKRIRANALAPGLIDTRMAERTKTSPDLLAKVAAMQPLGPLGEPSDVASAALYLASDESKFVTGVVLPIDGGWTAQ